MAVTSNEGTASATGAAGGADNEHVHAEHGVGFYVLIYFALLALTGLTFGMYKVDLGAASLPVALGIALTKSSLVLLFFMHLASEKGPSRLVLLIAVVFLALLTTFAIADVATRFPPAVPEEAPDVASAWKNGKPLRPHFDLAPTSPAELPRPPKR